MKNFPDVEKLLKERHPTLEFRAHAQTGPEEPYQDFPTHWIEVFGVDVRGQRDFLMGVRDLRPEIERLMGARAVFIFRKDVERTST